MQVDTGEEGCLRGVSMDPAQCNKAVLILDHEELLLILCVAVIGAPVLLGNDDVGYGELVPHQLTTEDPTRLHTPDRVGISQLEEFLTELPRDNDLAKDTYTCICGENGSTKTIRDTGKKNGPLGQYLKGLG